jgi:hypothetical protein
LKSIRALTFFSFCYRKDIHLIKTLCVLFNSEIRELPLANRRTGPQFNPRMFAKRQSKPAGGNALEEKKCCGGRVFIDLHGPGGVFEIGK